MEVADLSFDRLDIVFIGTTYQIMIDLMLVRDFLQICWLINVDG